MKSIFLGLQILVLACFIIGCKTIRVTQSKQKFDPHKPNQLLGQKMQTALFKDTINICIHDGAPKGSTIEQKIEDIKWAILTWIEPLRSISSKELARNINVIKDPECEQNHSKYDNAVVYSAENNRSIHFGLLNLTKIFSGPFSRRSILLHEIGHAMGLADTYIEGGTGCKKGQPESVMCLCTVEELFLDDILGVRVVFSLVNEHALIPELRKEFENSSFKAPLKSWQQSVQEGMEHHKSYEDLEKQKFAIQTEIDNFAGKHFLKEKENIDKLASDASDAEFQLNSYRGPLEGAVNRLFQKISVRQDSQSVEEMALALKVTVEQIRNPDLLISSEQRAEIARREQVYKEKFKVAEQARTELDLKVLTSSQDLKKSLSDINEKLIPLWAKSSEIQWRKLQHYESWLAFAKTIFSNLGQ